MGTPRLEKLGYGRLGLRGLAGRCGRLDRRFPLGKAIRIRVRPVVASSVLREFLSRIVHRVGESADQLPAAVGVGQDRMSGKAVIRESAEAIFHRLAYARLVADRELEAKVAGLRVPVLLQDAAPHVSIAGVVLKLPEVSVDFSRECDRLLVRQGSETRPQTGVAAFDLAMIFACAAGMAFGSAVPNEMTVSSLP
jgi:hypothetical protein